MIRHQVVQKQSTRKGISSSGATPIAGGRRMRYPAVCWWCNPSYLNPVLPAWSSWSFKAKGTLVPQPEPLDQGAIAVPVLLTEIGQETTTATNEFQETPS